MTPRRGSPPAPRAPRGVVRTVLGALALLLGGLGTSLATAGPDGDGAAARAPTRYHHLHVVDFDGEIEPALAAYTLRSLAAAQAAGADLVVLRIHSPGGRVDSSQAVANAVLDLPPTLPVVAWVPREAFSGASMVALACDEIVMGPAASIGDCQPILMGPDGVTPVGEKAETVLRTDFRRYAKANGWDPLLCEKLVSVDRELLEVRAKPDGSRRFVYADELDAAKPDDLVQGVRRADLERVRVVVAKGRLLTMTTDEAKDLGFVRRVMPTERALLAALRADGAQVTSVRMTWRERASRWLLGMTGVLGALILLCAGTTVFQGVGLSTVVGVAALALVGMVTATADLANGFPLLLVGIGIVLLAAEAFLIPGFGIAGVLGVGAVVAGFLSLATGFSTASSGGLSWETAAAFAVQFALTLVVGGALLLLLSRVVPSLPFARRRLHLPDGGLPAGAAVAGPGDDVGPGAEGVAATDLRPAGRATLGGRPVDVVSDGGFVPAGAAVRVHRVEGARVIVRARPPEARP